MSRISTFLAREKTKINQGLSGIREFNKAGTAGGLVFLLLLSGIYLYRMLLYSLNCIMPVFVSVIISLVLTVLGTELVRGLFILIVAPLSRKKMGLFFFFALLFMSETIVSSSTHVAESLIFALVVTAAVNIFGNGIWGLIRLRKHLAFGIVTTVLSAAVLAFTVLFLYADVLKSNEINEYIELSADDKADEDILDFYSKYGADGEYTVSVIDYDSTGNAGFTTDTVDLNPFASRGGVSKVLMDIYFDKKLEETDVRGRIYYPDKETFCPTLFIVHGNHDFYVDSYLGYEYLGNYLASLGYVVVSVDENMLNDLNGENDGRAFLFLKNIEAVLSECRKEESPIHDLIDENRLVIAGHSRGGESVATAYLYNGLSEYPDNGNVKFDFGFNISGIFAIAPTCDQYMPGGRTVRLDNVNYFLLHGTNDSDVYMVCGLKQYANVTNSSFDFFKGSAYVPGANHGQFNTMWGISDVGDTRSEFLNVTNLIDASAQREVLKLYMRSFLDYTLLGSAEGISLLKGESAYRLSLPSPVLLSNFEPGGVSKIASFEQGVDLKKADIPGACVSASGFSSWGIETIGYFSNSDFENHALRLKWDTSSGESATLSYQLPNLDLSSHSVFVRISDMNEDGVLSYDYSISLTDSHGNVISVSNPFKIYPSLSVKLYKLDTLFDKTEFKHGFQTITADFSHAAGADTFDFASVSRLDLSFSRETKGDLLLDDIF